MPVFFRWKFFLLELLLIAIVTGVGWFLIGYYTKHPHLDTGYQDWIYHAFRVNHFLQYDTIASWDHIWANGINHWRAFQYTEHVATAWIVKLFDLSVTQAMIWFVVVVFIGLRIVLYACLRFVGIRRSFSFLAVMLSYVVSQQWVAIKDFSLHIAFVIVPLYVVVWIAATKKSYWMYFVAALSGASWSLHPVIGYSTAAMFFLLLLTNNTKKESTVFWGSLVILVLSTLPFALPYLTSGYIVTNPHSTSTRFLQQVLNQEYMGLSLVYAISIVFSWTILFLRSNESPRWAKLLLAYCTLYLGFIYFGQLGYYPEFINKLQFPRAIPFIALVLPFCFAAFFQAAFGGIRSRLLHTALIALLAVSFTESVEIASQHTAQPVDVLEDPVAKYFENKTPPLGAIYVKEVPSASYFGQPGLRFITSYNRFPNPYPVRFNTLMKTDIAYTGVTDRQIDLINDYTLVAGVEYVFIPRLSPLVDALIQPKYDQPGMFELVGEVQAVNNLFAVLRNKQPLALAYAFEAEERDTLLRFDAFEKPTLQVASVESWDDEIQRVASHIRSEALRPLPVTFVWPDQVIVDTSSLQTMNQPEILVMQSFDQGWQKTLGDTLMIQPTSLRFMHIASASKNLSEYNQLALRNTWPVWHWPVQTLGILMIGIALGMVWWARRRETSSTNI